MKNEVSVKQAKAIAMMLQSIPQKDIAAELGITETNLSKWKKQEAFQTEYRRQIDEIMQIAAGEALATICDLMRHSNSDNVRIKAAQDILNRAGYKPTEKIEAKTENRNLNENKTIIVGWNDKDEELSQEELAKAQKDIENNPDEWITISYNDGK